MKEKNVGSEVSLGMPGCVWIATQSAHTRKEKKSVGRAETLLISTVSDCAESLAYISGECRRQ